MSHSGVVKMVQPDQSQHTAALREPHPTHNYLPNQWGLHRGSGGRGFMRERFMSRSVLKVLQIEGSAREIPEPVRQRHSAGSRLHTPKNNQGYKYNNSFFL